MKLITLLLASVLLTGCASFPFGKRVDPVVVQTQEVKRTPLNLPDPTPLKLNGIRWVLVTPDTIEEVWTKIDREGGDLVLFALTADQYEVLAMDMLQIRQFMEKQKDVIIKYREYYEPKEPKKP
jgi:hypothetical protein